MIMNVQQGWYRHYKGSYYKVLNVMQYVDSNYYLEEVLYEDRLGIKWSQPIGTFFGMIEKGNKRIPKVTYVGRRLPKITVAE